MNSNIIKIGVIILILILGIIAISTKYWSTNNIKIYGVNAGIDIGLWKVCTYMKGKNQDKTICNNTNKQNGPDLKHLNAVKILSISSIVLVVISLYLIYAMPKHKEYFILSLVLAGILSIISVILWNNDPSLKNTTGDKSNDLKPGYSFYLELSSGLIAILLGILTQTNIIA